MHHFNVYILQLHKKKALVSVSICGQRGGTETVPSLCTSPRGTIPHACVREEGRPDRKSTRLNSSHANISYAVFCLKKNKCRYPPRCRSKCSSPFSTRSPPSSRSRARPSWYSQSSDRKIPPLNSSFAYFSVAAFFFS